MEAGRHDAGQRDDRHIRQGLGVEDPQLAAVRPRWYAVPKR